MTTDHPDDPAAETIDVSPDSRDAIPPGSRSSATRAELFSLVVQLKAENDELRGIVDTVEVALSKMSLLVRKIMEEGS